MTLKQAKKLHKELWGWLAKNPSKDKWHWPQWKENGGKLKWVEMGCFGCEIANGNCVRCPIIWPDGECCNSDDTGLYERWARARKKDKPLLAIQIRDLPWRY